MYIYVDILDNSISAAWKLTGSRRMNTYRLNGSLREVIGWTHIGRMYIYINILDNCISAAWKLTGSCQINTYRLYGSLREVCRLYGSLRVIVGWTHIGCMCIYTNILDNSISARMEAYGWLSDEHISAVWKLTGDCQMNTYRLCVYLCRYTW